MLRFGGLLFLALVAFWLFCLLDAATTDPGRVRGLPKWVWVLVILLTLDVGAVCWLVAGRLRPEHPDATGFTDAGAHARGRGWPTAASLARARRPAPDDDQEFLADLDRRSDAAYRQMLDQWEADLRRREEEARQREHGEDDLDDHPDA